MVKVKTVRSAIQCLQNAVDPLLGICSRRLSAPACEYFIRMVMSMVIMMIVASASAIRTMVMMMFVIMMMMVFMFVVMLMDMIVFVVMIVKFRHTLSPFIIVKCIILRQWEVRNPLRGIF